jgi:prepilin-type N-terminal cleavage/methylation domain-containing protein
MRRSKRSGFTFIELLTVMIVIGLLAAIGVPRIRTMKERAYQATLRSDLGALRTAQEAYFAEHHRYSTNVVALDMRLSRNVSVSIEAADPYRGWKAAARHAWLQTPCTTAAGIEAVGVEAGAILCSNVTATLGSVTQSD